MDVFGPVRVAVVKQIDVFIVVRAQHLCQYKELLLQSQKIVKDWSLITGDGGHKTERGQGKF